MINQTNYDAIMDVNQKRNAKTINYILALTILILGFFRMVINRLFFKDL